MYLWDITNNKKAKQMNNAKTKIFNKAQIEQIIEALKNVGIFTDPIEAGFVAYNDGETVMRAMIGSNGSYLTRWDTEVLNIA